MSKPAPMVIDRISDIEIAIQMDRDSECSDCTAFSRRSKGEQNLQLLMEWWLSEELRTVLESRTCVECNRSAKLPATNTSFNFRIDTPQKSDIGIMLLQYQHEPKLEIHYQLQVPHFDLKLKKGHPQEDPLRKAQDKCAESLHQYLPKTGKDKRSIDLGLGKGPSFWNDMKKAVIEYSLEVKEIFAQISYRQ